MNRETDGRLKEFFEREAGKMTAPDSLKDRIDRELAVIDSMRENEEHSERKGSDMRFKKRKLVLAAAAEALPVLQQEKWQAPWSAAAI